MTKKCQKRRFSVVDQYILANNQDLIIPTKNGKAIRIPVTEIPLKSLKNNKTGRQKSRKPSGVKVITLDPNDEVTGIAITKNLEIFQKQSNKPKKG